MEVCKTSEMESENRRQGLWEAKDLRDSLRNVTADIVRLMW